MVASVTASLPSNVTRYEDYQSQKAQKSDELGRKEFLLLLTTQLNNQNPLDPMQNEAFVAQLAQFSTLEAVTSMSDSLDTMTGTMRGEQVLAASALIGRTVASPTGQASLSGDKPVEGFVSPAMPSEVRVDVIGPKGDVVRSLALGSVGVEGRAFTWDGLNQKGERAPDGLYRMQATAQVGGFSTVAPVSSNVQVRGVSSDPTTGGVMLEIDGGGRLKLSDVKRIGA